MKKIWRNSFCRDTSKKKAILKDQILNKIVNCGMSIDNLIAIFKSPSLVHLKTFR